MNIFIIGTGRCGTKTFIKACSHITNYTSGHESNHSGLIGARLYYPDNHIEADNRLSWMLGPLEEFYKRNVFYVHLIRDPDQVALSFIRRAKNPDSIINGFQRYIASSKKGEPVQNVASMYVHTVRANITSFLSDKQHMVIDIDTPREDFANLWTAIGAEGNLAAALKEFNTRYNSHQEWEERYHD